jgi:hypothetical protein
MSTTQNKAAVRVAVIAGVALSVAGTTATANAETTPAGSSAAVQSAGAPAATPSTAGLTAQPGVLVAAGNTAPVTVSRVSVATGSQAGGTVLTVLGANLAEEVVEAPADPAPADPAPADPAPAATTTAVSWTTPTVTFTIPAVKGGTATTITAEDVTVLSDGAVRVVVPPSAVVGKSVVSVTNGTASSSTTKGPAFTYTAAAPVVSSVAGTLTSEAGGTVTINGTYLGDKATKVLIGGKAAKVSTDSTASTLTVTAPAGLAGVQDVVVTTKGGTVDGGNVSYSAKPVTVTWGAPKVTVEKGGAFDITGVNLNTVVGGTFTDSAGHVAKVTVKQPTATADKGKGLKLTVTVPNKAGKDAIAAGEGTIVLNSAYASSAPQKITVVKVGAPTITSKDVTLTVAGGSATLVGTNLHYITSVKLGTTVLTAGTGYTVNEAGTELTLTVPAQTKAAKLPVTVVTDGGTASYSLPVSAVLTSAAYDAGTKVVTLSGSGLGSLTGIKVTDAAKATVATTFKAATDGKKSVATAYKTALAAGTYTVTAGDASGATFSTTFTVASDVVVAPAVITGASFADGTLSLTGTDLDTLTGVKVTGPAPAVTEQPGTFAAASATSATVTGLTLEAGDYTVAGTSAGTTVTKSFTVAQAAPVVTVDATAVYSVTDKTVTVTGTHLDTVASFTLAGKLGAVTGVTLDPSSAATTAVLKLTDVLVDDDYTVTAKDAGGASVGEATFTVGTPAP